MSSLGVRVPYIGSGFAVRGVGFSVFGSQSKIASLGFGVASLG